MAENLRNIWNVSPMTHCDVICLLSGCKPLHIGLQQRFCKFAEGIYRHGSHTLRAIANSALSNPMSVFCDNFNEYVGHNSRAFNAKRQKIYLDWINTVSDDLRQKVVVLRELIGIRNGKLVCPGLTSDEVNYMIDDICIR